MVHTRQKHKQERKNNGDYAGDHCIEIYFENRTNVSICHKFMRCFCRFFSHLFTFQVYAVWCATKGNTKAVRALDSVIVFCPLVSVVGIRFVHELRNRWKGCHLSEIIDIHYTQNCIRRDSLELPTQFFFLLCVCVCLGCWFWLRE